MYLLSMFGQPAMEYMGDRNKSMKNIHKYNLLEDVRSKLPVLKWDWDWE